MKNKDIKIVQTREDEKFNKGIYCLRIRRLENNLKRNQEAIKKLNKDSIEKQICSVDDEFSANLKELSNLKEMQNDLKDKEAMNKINRLENLYNEVQNNYLNKKIKIIDEKMLSLNQNVNSSIDRIKKSTNEITGNILFSVIGILLGVSLISAMTGAIKGMEAKYYFPYYVTMGWLAILVLGFSYLLVRDYDKKSTAILIVVVFATLALLCVFYFSFFRDTTCL